MSDYFGRAAARADPAAVARRLAAPVAGPLDGPDMGVEEVEVPIEPSHEGARVEAPGNARREPLAAPSPEPWPRRPIVEPQVRDLPVDPASPVSPVTPVAAPHDQDLWDRASPEPGEPPASTFQPRPVEREANHPAPEIERLVPVPPEQVALVAGPEPAHPDELQVPVAPTPPVPPPPDDPLALADAVMWVPVEPSAAIVPPPETSAPDLPAEPTPGASVVIDRLTVELVDDRSAPASDPAPSPRRRPRPAGRLVSGRRFDSGWGW